MMRAGQPQSKSNERAGVSREAGGLITHTRRSTEGSGERTRGGTRLNGTASQSTSATDCLTHPSHTFFSPPNNVMTANFTTEHIYPRLESVRILLGPVPFHHRTQDHPRIDFNRHCLAITFFHHRTDTRLDSVYGRCLTQSLLTTEHNAIDVPTLLLDPILSQPNV